MTQVNGAFIDFWSDAITDPITENWPSFVICGLKPLPAAVAVNWLIVEQTCAPAALATPHDIPRAPWPYIASPVVPLGHFWHLRPQKGSHL